MMPELQIFSKINALLRASMKSNIALQLTAQVSHLEVLCKQLYESQSASERSEAEKALVTFQNAPDGLDKCQGRIHQSI